MSFFEDKSLFNLSFNEEENNFILEIVCKKQMDDFIKNQYLITAVDDKVNSKYIYKFGSYEKNAIVKLYSELKDNNDVETAELNF